MPRWVTQMPVVEQDWTSELSVLEGHTDRIEAIAFSPTDNLVVSTSSLRKGSRLWDYVTGTELFRFDGEMGYGCAAFSPDGRLVALGSPSGSISVREFGKGSAIDLKGHDGGILHVAFSPKSGKVLASTSFDGTLRIWNVDKRQTTHTCCLQEGSRGLVTEFTPDGRFLIVGEVANMTMWNVDTGECVKTFDEVDTMFVKAVAISMDGEKVVLLQAPNKACLFDLSTGRKHFEAGYFDDVGSILLLPPDENFVLVGSKDGSIELRDINTWSVVRKFHTSRTAKCFAVSRDGELLVSGGVDGNLRLWDMRSAIGNKVPERSSDPVDFVRFSPDDSLILSGMSKSGRSREPEAHMWHVADGSVKSLPIDPVKWMKFSPDGKFVVLELDRGNCQLWNQSMTTRMLDSKGLRKVVFSPDGSCLALLSTDWKTIEIVDSTTFQEMLTWNEQSIVGVQFSPNSQIVGMLDLSHTMVDLWHLPSRKRLWHLTPPSVSGHLYESSSHSEFSPNSQMVASLWNYPPNPYVCAWKMLEIATGKEKWVHVPDGLHLVFHPESHLIAIETQEPPHTSGDLYITTYETDSLNLKHCFEVGPVGERCTLLSMAISAIGKLVAASSTEWDNRTVQMWDTTTGMEIGRYSIKDGIGHLSFLDDRYLLCDQGRLPVPSLLPDQEEMDLNNKPEDAQDCLFVGFQWVYQGSERLLWLPPAYRSKASVLRGETLALVHETGKVRIVKFNLAETPVSTVQQNVVPFPS